MILLPALSRMHRVFHILVFRNMNPTNPIFERSEHVEITRHEVQTIRRMFQEFKYPISYGLKCLLCGMEDALSSCTITVCDYRPLRFARIAGFRSSVKTEQ